MLERIFYRHCELNLSIYLISSFWGRCLGNGSDCLHKTECFIFEHTKVFSTTRERDRTLLLFRVPKPMSLPLSLSLWLSLFIDEVIIEARPRLSICINVYLFHYCCELFCFCAKSWRNIRHIYMLRRVVSDFLFLLWPISFLTYS